jgi:hypothetical protein
LFRFDRRSDTPTPSLTRRCSHHQFNYIDRTNIGNAKVAGMDQDLNLSSTDYASEFDAGLFKSSSLFSLQSKLIRSTSSYISAALR